MIVKRKQNHCQRRGAAAVEFALVAPIFILLVLGIIEFGRLIMVQQILVNASREGARIAVVDGSTAGDVTATVAEYLEDASINVSQEGITVSPDPMFARDNEKITVSVSVPFAEVSWMKPFMFFGDLDAVTTMRSEKLE